MKKINLEDILSRESVFVRINSPKEYEEIIKNYIAYHSPGGNTYGWSLLMQSFDFNTEFDRECNEKAYMVLQANDGCIYRGNNREHYEEMCEYNSNNFLVNLI